MLFKEFQNKMERCILREDTKIVYDPLTGNEYQLNSTAFFLISRLKSHYSESEIVSELILVYGIEKDVAINSIQGLIDQFDALKENNVLNQIQKVVDHSILNFPFNIEIELTQRCNLYCKFCYNIWKNSNDNNSVKNDLPLHTIYKILDECKEKKVFSVRYSGGEPTLHPNFHDIIRYGSHLGLGQVIFTNGTMLEKEEAAFWKANNVNRVLISLHGLRSCHDNLTKVTGSFDKAIRSVEICKNAGLNVALEFTLTSKNMCDVFQFIELAKKLKVTDVILMRYVPTGRDDELFLINNKEMLELIEKLNEETYGINIYFPCSQKFCLSDTMRNITPFDMSVREQYLMYSCKAGLTWLSISYDGFLRICPHSNKYFANMITDESITIEETWKNDIRPFVHKKIEIRKKECQTCIAFSKCLGGCFL